MKQKKDENSSKPTILTNQDYERIADLERRLNAAIQANDLDEMGELVFDIKEQGYHKSGVISIKEAERKLCGEDWEHSFSSWWRWAMVKINQSETLILYH